MVTKLSDLFPLKNFIFVLTVSNIFQTCFRNDDQKPDQAEPITYKENNVYEYMIRIAHFHRCFQIIDQRILLQSNIAVVVVYQLWHFIADIISVRPSHGFWGFREKGYLLSGIWGERSFIFSDFGRKHNFLGLQGAGG